MDLKFLDFEQPIAELEAKIDELRYVGDDSEININEEVARLKDKSESLTKSIFAKLSPWQVTLCVWARFMPCHSSNLPG